MTRTMPFEAADLHSKDTLVWLMLCALTVVFFGFASVRLIESLGGYRVSDNYKTDAYGNVLATSGVTQNAYRFGGEQYDSDLYMNVLRARYLNLTNGRFNTFDTFETGANDPWAIHKYAFAKSSPVNFIDPSGNFSILEAAVVGSSLGILAGGANVNFYSPSAKKRDRLTVHVWTFRGSTEAWGHASVTLGDAFNTHISWWPSGIDRDRLKELPLLRDIYSVKARDRQTFQDDIDFEEQAPDRNITIGGLDNAKIRDWWASYKTSHLWETFSHNCSTTVADALKAGGGNADWSTANNYPWTPADVDAFARSIQQSLLFSR